jgi:hypothetical protein
MVANEAGEESRDWDSEADEVLDRDLEGAKIAVRGGVDAISSALQVAHPDVAP